MKYEIIVLKWKKNRLNFIHLNISINFLFHLALDIIMAEAYEKVYTVKHHNVLQDIMCYSFLKVKLFCCALSIQFFFNMFM